MSLAGVVILLKMGCGRSVWLMRHTKAHFHIPHSSSRALWLSKTRQDLTTDKLLSLLLSNTHISSIFHRPNRPGSSRMHWFVAVSFMSHPCHIALSTTEKYSHEIRGKKNQCQVCLQHPSVLGKTSLPFLLDFWSDHRGSTYYYSIFPDCPDTNTPSWRSQVFTWPPQSTSSLNPKNTCKVSISIWPLQTWPQLKSKMQ